MTTLRAARRALAEPEERASQWTGGPALWLDGREIVHMHQGPIEIRVTRKHAGALEGDDRVWRRGRSSAWFAVDSTHEELALELIRLAIDANSCEMSGPA